MPQLLESTAARDVHTIPGFHLLSVCGYGGMGAVYKARQVSMDRLVAIKVLTPSLAEDPAQVERFHREARAVAQLNHPNIIRGLDVGEASGLHYFVMEYVDGRTVQEILRTDGRLPEARALEIARQIALALEHARRAGIIHRDVKPDNIIINRKGAAKLADLGIARDLTSDCSTTQAGTTLGSPHYMSPEQARGSRDLDTRADIYSLGATLYHMVTGTVPFDGKTSAAILSRHIKEPPSSVTSLNPSITRRTAELIDRMLRKDPAERPQSPQAVADAIDRPQASPAPVFVPRIAPRPLLRTRRRARPRRRKGSALGTLLAIAALLAVIAATAAAAAGLIKLP